MTRVALAGLLGRKLRTILTAVAIAISSSRPFLSNSLCAVGRSKPASVAPPIVATEPNLTMPEMRRRWMGPVASTPISSPTAKCFFFAVA